MIVNLILDDATASILRYYGDISAVVNKILGHGAVGDIPIMDLPATPLPTHGVRQYKINVTDEHYLQLCEMYGTKSSRISLRRIVYWFVENEKYVDFNWSSEETFIANSKQEMIGLIGDIESKLYKLYRLLDQNQHVKNIKSELDEIKQEVWDA